MTTIDSSNITPYDFQILVRRAGLELTPEELERLRPMYQTMMDQISKLHDPSLPLEGPAHTYRPA